MIRYTCLRCKTVLETDDALGMKTEQCPVCKGSNQVPPSKAQREVEKKQQKAVLRQQKEESRRHAEQQRQEELAKKAEAERLERQRDLELQQQYAVAVQEAKAEPTKPKVWYCRLQDGNQHGPMQETVLQKWIENGRLGLAARLEILIFPYWITQRRGVRLGSEFC